MDKKEAQAAMIADLDRSGIDEKDIKKLGLVLEEVELKGQTTGFTGKPKTAWSYRIPYFDISGKKTSFYRHRFLEEVYSGGKGKEKRRLMRYTQPENTLPKFYLPAIIDWKHVSQITTMPLIITEGEKKAIKASLDTGIPTIGLGGVWSWKSKKLGLPAIKDFDDFSWTRREVLICYDTDMLTNPMVMDAMNSLAQFLTGLGSRVKMIDMPHRVDEKMGLDDFLAQVPGAAHMLVEELIPNAEEFAISKELWSLNEELALIYDPECVKDLKLGTIHPANKSALANGRFSNRIIEGADGPQKVDSVVIKRWMEWKFRRDHIRMEYAPGEQEVLPGNTLNTWLGWGTEPKEGTVQPFLDLLDFVFGGDTEKINWFTKWLAYPIQHPGTKLQTAVLLWSNYQGVGKTLIGDLVGDIYGKNYVKITQLSLQSNFTGWIADKQFIVGEEITGTEHRQFADLLKGYITNEEILVNRKHQSEYISRNCANFLFTSNHPNALYIENRDRRYFVHEVTTAARADSFYERIRQWRKANQGATLFHYLLNEVDVSDFNPWAAALGTKDKLGMVEQSRSVVERFATLLIQDPEQFIPHLDRDWFSLEELKTFAPEEVGGASSKSLGTALRAEGSIALTLRTNQGVRVLYCIRNIPSWAKALKKEDEEPKTTAVRMNYDQSAVWHSPSENGPRRRKVSK